MKAVSQTFKDNYKTMGRQLDDKLYYTNNGVIEYIDNEDINSITPSFQSNILKSAMKELVIDSNIDIPKDTILTYEHGVKVADNEVEDYRENYEYINYGNYIVYESEKNEDTNSYSIVCYDKMLYAMKDYEVMNITYPITIRNYINAICTHLGLTFANTSDTFTNYDKQIQTELYLDASGNSLGYTFRDVLDELAQVTASTICINNNDELEVRYLNDTNTTINEAYLKDVNVSFGEMYGPINTIVLSRNGADKIYLSYPEDLPEADRKAIEIKDNQIMNFNDRDAYISDILYKLRGLNYYLNDYTSIGIPWYEMCDKYNISVGETTYNCVMFNSEFLRTQGVSQNIHTDMPEDSETDYKKADKTDRRINQTYFIVDKQNQVIESVISNVSEQDSKISQITQTVDELNSKIQDIADITISGESTFATFTLDNVNESEPIQIKVKPVNDNISYLYPNTNLFPSSSTYLKVRTIRFHNDTTNEDIDYVLPDDLLIYDSTHYDEFYLDYDSHTCQVTKRCKYNANGSVSLLDNEQIVSYPYPSIILNDGDYTLTLLGYEYGYLFVRLMAKNIYTSQFYTKVETDSRINQKASEIELGVSQTLTNYSTTTEMNSAINVKANEINSVVSTKVGNDEIISKINQSAEAITINADKVDIDGKAVHFKTNINETKGPYTQQDANRAYDIYLGSITPTQNDYEKYDLDGNNIISLYDAQRVQFAVNNGGYINYQGTYEINPYSSNRSIALYDSTQNYYQAVVSLEGSTFRTLNAKTINLLGNANDETTGLLTRSGLTLEDNNGRIQAFNATAGNDTTLMLENKLTHQTTEITAGGIVTPTITQTSQEKFKKNFEKLDNALKIIKDTEIYKYNLKDEKDDDKKHIGFVIGDKYKYSKEITSKENDGVDIYSFVAVCCKAIQEQQEQIEELKREIKSLKESDK